MTLSHTHSTKPPEKLSEHRKLTEKYFDLIVREKNLKEVFDRFFEIFGFKDKEFGFRIIKDAVVLHDEGKVNPNFQYFVMGNKEFKSEAYSKSDTNHSMLSAVMFYERYIDKITRDYIVEVKKSDSCIEEGAKWQLLYYIWILKCHKRQV